MGSILPSAKVRQQAVLAGVQAHSTLSDAFSTSPYRGVDCWPFRVLGVDIPIKHIGLCFRRRC